MLKKLYKYELYSLFRNLLPIYAAVLGFALLSRLTLLIKTDNPLLQIPAGISTTVYAFSIIAVFVVGMAVLQTPFIGRGLFNLYLAIYRHSTYCLQTALRRVGYCN